MNQYTKKDINEKSKASFVLYKDQYYVVKELPDEMAGKLFKFILNYVNNISFEIEDFALKMAWLPIKLQLDRDSEKYIQVCEKNSENARIRWKKNYTGASNGNRTDPKHADNDTGNDTGNEIDNNNNKCINDVFSAYLEILKSDKENQWRESIYAKFRLKNGSLEKLLNEFKLSEISAGKESLDKDLVSFKTHFRNWLNTINNFGNLDEFRNFKDKKPSII